jgi:predicted dehydrogenase
VKVLIVGLGAAGQRHARNVRSILGERVDLLACRSRLLPGYINEKMEVEPGDRAEVRLGLRVFTNLQVALAERPDAVVVSNPTSMHIEVAQAAADAGCHIFIEKPLSDKLDGIKQLLATVEGKGLVCMVAYQLRFHPCIRMLRELVHGDAVGRVIGVRAVYGEYLPAWHPYEDYRCSYAARRDLGGGVILTQIHDLDYLTWIFGWPRQIFSVGGHLSSLEVDVEDTASTLMECGGRSGKVPVHLHQDFVQSPPVRSCEVVGDKGKILVDVSRCELQATDTSGEIIAEHRQPLFERNELFVDEMRHFLDCVKQGAVPCVSLRDGANSLRVALASLESLHSGQAISFSAI